MELELGLAPPNSTGGPLGELSGAEGVSASGGKRDFGEAFEEEREAAAATTLPLFDDGSSTTSSTSTTSRKKPLVGWPPVSATHSRAIGRHVKVRKEGEAIGRKVHLSLRGSYGELRATLARMFPATNNVVSDRGGSGKEEELVVTYEDADGDWMLVGDVPWEDFARSVKRMKILL